MKMLSRVVYASVAVFTSTSAFADDILELNRSFIEKYKTRLTISV